MQIFIQIWTRWQVPVPCHNLFSHLVFFVTLQEFSAFLYIKAVWGIDENLGYELETVLNSTFYYEMHSMNTRRCATSRFNDSSSGAKVIILFERAKSIHLFFPLSLLFAHKTDCGSFCGTSQKSAY